MLTLYFLNMSGLKQVGLALLAVSQASAGPLENLVKRDGLDYTSNAICAA
jgi:hypothetical protein